MTRPYLAEYVCLRQSHKESNVQAIPPTLPRQSSRACATATRWPLSGSVNNNDAWGKRITQPDEIGGRETQCSCLIVADADAHYARAKGAGAVIIDELETKDYGGKGYSCRDPEGHLWWFGTYDPWKRSE
jgi:hypothetical protein